tara:strand:+ start:668 stop:880 length:213 start_codon:yes stop_codon:yes gene_type:complete
MLKEPDPATIIKEAVPDLPSLVAVIVTEPADTPLTRPEADTEATVLSEEDHVTARLVSVFPEASLVMAVS